MVETKIRLEAGTGVVRRMLSMGRAARLAMLCPASTGKSGQSSERTLAPGESSSGGQGDNGG